MFSIQVSWKREKEFKYETFNRAHTVTLTGNKVRNSAAPEYQGDADTTNPEELLASALASCHMLTFLAVASKMHFIVDQYDDNATAVLEKNEEGRLAVTAITLKPKIVFGGDQKPTDEQLKSMHEKAHKNCFIANSIKTKVTFL